ncbi:potassium/sodium hyperpolarization-activated cyclic nucleotide-gated channel 2 [Harpegnathos saltator]|uniref:Potassium/sodium hyperpolarization-activated cyclic nucleotide-gated channel 2 n=1 Tax=Harpegnathos saltator TaxID=610380 RepID=E2BQ05_HARSA|nr:potassium/sodium hyperpolarization-activated cyclic nucleotide-gated channel 2 [Harpegnathos saltator]EFN82193.1 Potassium/sodium hyperpolarization-activated cyclic nucleotide-gated channel 2 [Harpegnathos saltator]
MLRVEHECELLPKQEDIFFLPDRGLLRRALDAFRRLLMVSERNPGTRKYLRSRANIISEKRRHLRNYRYILHPFSILRLYWDFMMILTMTCLFLAVPYKSGFEMSDRPLYWTVLKNSLLFVCCMDIAVNFATGYLDHVQHNIVMEPRKIMKRYTRHGTFVPDLLGSLPTDIAFADGEVWREYKVARELASLMCLFRVFSFSRYMRKIAHAYDAPMAIYEVCEVIFWLAITLHWQSCFYWLVPVATTSMRLPERPSNDSWIHTMHLWEAPKGRQYLLCLLRAVPVFLRSGCLHSKPKNEADLTMLIILQILGTLIFYILTTRAMQLLKGANGSKIKYHSHMEQLKRYMRHRQLPHSTQRRIVAYYKFRFQHRYFRESEILNTLSTQMRQEIGMHACRNLVENVTFFNNLPFLLLARIVGLLKSEIFLTNDVIMRVNQPGDCMYFIAAGTVAIYTSSGKEVCHLEDGAHFGEIALVMPDERRIASVVAVEICELYRLDRVDFAKTIHPYPMLWERIKNIAVERHEKTMILNNTAQ